MVINSPYWLLLFIIILPFFIKNIYNKKRAKDNSLIKDNDLTIRKYKDKFFRLLLLRTIAIILAVLSIAEISIILPSKKNNIILLFDTSKSIKLEEIEKARNSAIEFLNQINKLDKISIVTFAGDAKIKSEWVEPKKAIELLESIILNAPNQEETNIKKALDLSMELFKNIYGNKSILLFSDGRDTSGNITLNEFEKLRNIAVYIYPLGENSSSLISDKIEIPQIVHSGERFVMNWEVFSTKEQWIDIVIKLNGKTYIKEKIKTNIGKNNIPFELKIDNSGIYQIDATAGYQENNINNYLNTSGIIKIQGEKEILLIDNNRKISNIYKLLVLQNINVKRISSFDLPESSTLMHGFNAVVLDNISANNLNDKQQEALKEYVTNGGGLLVIGGDNSLGRGEYYSSKLEDILPVHTDTRKRILFTRVSILFITDQSGSMEESVGRFTKQEVAMQGIKEAIKELKPQDEIGILSFDSKAYWVLPFTQVTNKDEIISSLSQIRKGGGTNLVPALEEAINAYSNTLAYRRHIILLSDGITMGENFELLANKLKTLEATITTLGVGEEVNEELLSNLARWSDGKYYKVNLDDVPKIMKKETIRVTNDLVQEGNFNIKIKNNSFPSQEIQTYPNILGYIVTKAKSVANVYLEVGKDDPLLTIWNYGNGKVAVFASDSGSRWLSSWSNNEQYNILWKSIIKYLEKEESNDFLNLNASINNSLVKINVEAIQEDRALKSGLNLVGFNSSSNETFYFKELSYGFYEANYLLPKPGLNIIEIHDYENKNFKIINLWNNANQEYQKLGPDFNLFKTITTISNCMIIDKNDKINLKRSFSFGLYSLQYLFIILSCVFFIIELGYRSVSSGQLNMFKIILENWWETQKIVVNKFSNIKIEYRDTLFYNEDKKTFNLYKYLAKKLKKKL